MRIVFFDFDGTITSKDSLAEFIKFAITKKAYYLGLLKLSHILIAYKLKLISNNIAKEKLISHFFMGWEEEVFQAIADKYAITQIEKIIRPEALQKIAWHQEQGHKIVIVSASMENWIKKWCENNGLELIATILEVKQGKLTGIFKTKNCYGIEKANRIKERFNLDDYDFIYAYGDSSGDKEMLGLANESLYKPFR